jgi:Predicted nucleotide-binding protein containing TIR-like domain
MQPLSPMPRPTIFIGSSSEQLQTARALREKLSTRADAVVWNEYPWSLGESVFANLLNAADGFDFAVFVFAGDDLATIRNSSVSTVRDNVVFELGLFLGKMGKERAWWLSPEGSASPHTLTDLEGIVHLTYASPTGADSSSFQRSLLRASDEICTQIKRLGLKTRRTVDVLKDVRILCASSSDYPEENYESDIAEIRRNFPVDSILELRRVSADTLATHLRSPWDIIHLAVRVDNETGDVLLPDPDSTKANPLKDRFPRNFFLARVGESNARLVIIVTCESLVLAARLARITNAIAAIHQIQFERAIRWSKEFYWYLAQGRSLNDSFNRAQPLDPCVLLLTRNDFRLELPRAKTLTSTPLPEITVVDA